MRERYVVANYTNTAWFSHLEAERVMWTRKRKFATAMGVYAAKRIARKYGGVIQPALSVEELAERVSALRSTSPKADR